MSHFKAFEYSADTVTDGDHLSWMMGCDGEQHARSEATITFKNGEGVAGISHGAKVIGHCDGSCHGKLSEHSGFSHTV